MSLMASNPHWCVGGLVVDEYAELLASVILNITKKSVIPCFLAFSFALQPMIIWLPWLIHSLSRGWKSFQKAVHGCCVMVVAGSYVANCHQCCWDTNKWPLFDLLGQ